MRVLIVEDKPKMAELLQRALRGEGLADVASCGEDALWMAGATGCDAVVLDVMLPGIDGIQTCRRLRDDNVWAPVLMLTARGQLADRVAGLDCGADDYLTKPFELAELMARLRALIRRQPAKPGDPRGRRPVPGPRDAASLASSATPAAAGQVLRAAGDLHAPPRRRALALRAAGERMGQRI